MNNSLSLDTSIYQEKIRSLLTLVKSHVDHPHTVVDTESVLFALNEIEESFDVIFQPKTVGQ